MYFVICVTFFSILAAIAYTWIWALLHCRGNLRLARVRMEWWLIFIAITPPFGALAYLLLHRDDPMVLHLGAKH